MSDAFIDTKYEIRMEMSSHPRGCSARTGTSYVVLWAPLGSEGDYSFYSAPQRAIAFGFPSERRRIFDKCCFYHWRTLRMEGGRYSPIVRYPELK